MHLVYKKAAEEVTIFQARMFYENAVASAFPVVCCGVSERTTIKWHKYLTFRRFAAGSFNCRRETVEKDVPPGHRRGLGPRRTLEQYVAGPNSRGRPEGLTYPRSQSRRGVMKYPGYPGLLGWERFLQTKQLTQQIYALGECPVLT